MDLAVNSKFHSQKLQCWDQN